MYTVSDNSLEMQIPSQPIAETCPMRIHTMMIKVLDRFGKKCEESKIKF